MRLPVRCATGLIAALIAVGAPNGTNAIVIRHDVSDTAYRANERDWPAIFSLYRTRAGHPDCMATLIAPRLAITAKHCTETTDFLQRVAADGGGFPVEISGATNRVVRRRLPSNPAHARRDVALLVLCHPVSQVRPLALYRRGDELGRTVHIPGWGGTGDGKVGLRAADGNFRVATNRVDRVEDGRLLWTFDDPSSGRALPLEGVSGPGDSGGPALIRRGSQWAIAGVSSAQLNEGGPKGTYGVTEIFVRVSEVARWIDAERRALAPQGCRPSSRSTTAT